MLRQKTDYLPEDFELWGDDHVVELWYVGEPDSMTLVGRFTTNVTSTTLMESCLDYLVRHYDEPSHFEPGRFWPVLMSFLQDIANGEYVVEEIRDTAAWLLDEAHERRDDI